MPKPRRSVRGQVLLVNDTTDWYHWGCTCTSTAMRESITAQGYDVKSLPITATYGLQSPPNKITDYVDPLFYQAFAAANSEVIKAIRNCDVVVVNGEGTLHGTRPVVRGLLYLAYVAKTQLGKTVHLINHSCFPESAAKITDGAANALYTNVYQELDYVAVREPVSAEILRTLGVSAVQAFDSLPLYVADHFSEAERPVRAGAVLAGSVIWRGEMIPVLVELIRLLGDRDLPVTLLTGAAANPAREDGALVAALREALPEGWTHVEAVSADEWLRTIAGGKLLVSGRFHHSIAALSLGTPIVALNSNTPKMDGLLGMVGQLPPLQAADDNVLEEILERVDRILAGDGRVLSVEALAELRALARKNYAGFMASADPVVALENHVEPVRPAGAVSTG